MTLDTLAHVGEALTILTVGWRVNRGFSRIIDALENFPPHRHSNGAILYPKGFDPPEIERLGTRTNTAPSGPYSD
jgi:hypothetical protein